jgi:DNA-binding Lrp family transcriptional regulator
MVNSIGDSAGKIWKFLNKNGPTSVSKVSTETGISKNEVQRAIGWLAREEKILLEQKGRTETISLS